MFDPITLKAYKIAFLKYRTLINKNRWHTFNTVDQNPGRTVEELAKIANFKQAILSQNLSMLRKANILNVSKVSRTCYYGVNDQIIAQMVDTAKVIMPREAPKAQSSSELVSLYYPNLKKAYQIFKQLATKNRIYILDYLYHHGPTTAKAISEDLKIHYSDVYRYLTMFLEIEFVQKLTPHGEYHLNIKHIQNINHSLSKWSS